jgi:Tol biopolymer transport system component
MKRSSYIGLVAALTLTGLFLTAPGTRARSINYRQVNGHIADDQDDRGRIAFVSFRGGNNDIYVIRPDGTGLINVTNNPASDRLPAWSPDGSMIAFRSTRDGNQEIYVMNDDGSNVVRLTFDAAVDTSPSWTRDGRVLFSSNRSGRFEIYEINANGIDLRHINIPVDGNLTFPSESREGDRLAFTVTNFSDAVSIWDSHSDGTHPTQLTPDALVAAFPDWSPIGNSLIFSNNVCPVCDLSETLVINQGGNRIRQLSISSDGNNDLFPRWSPDGSQIVFSRDDFVNPTQIYIMNSDGSDVVNVTQDTFFDLEADWGPGSRHGD